MAAPQNVIAIVYDYDQTLSPTYMQEEVLFPAFGIDSRKFWQRCAELVKEQGFDSELAYMKVMLDYLGIFDDVAADPFLAQRLPVLQAEGVRSMLVIPLQVSGERNGTSKSRGTTSRGPSSRVERPSRGGSSPASYATSPRPTGGAGPQIEEFS